TPGQRDVDRFLRETLAQRLVGERGLARAQRRLDALLGFVQRTPGGGALGRRQRTELLHLGPERTVLAQRARLGVGQLVRAAGDAVRAEEALARRRPLGGGVHRSLCAGPAQAAPREAFSCATIAAKAGVSATARSASTLRSRPIDALFSQAMNVL